MKMPEEKMSTMGKLILFTVLAVVIFLVVIMEKESQEREARLETKSRVLMNDSLAK